MTARSTPADSSQKALDLMMQAYALRSGKGQTRTLKRARRGARQHAKYIQANLPERAAVWRKRARNG
jgi:hypothetical protein